MNAFEQGYEAFGEGITKDKNPYHEQPEFNQWNNGWNEAEEDKDTPPRTYLGIPSDGLLLGEDEDIDDEGEWDGGPYNQW